MEDLRKTTVSVPEHATMHPASHAPSGVHVYHCHCQGLRMASRRITQYYDERLVVSGLRVMQYSILAVVSRNDGASIGELAVALLLDRTVMGKNLKPLERDGLIAISRSSADGRSRAVHLTAAGRAALSLAQPLWKKAQREFEASYGGERVHALKGLLLDVISIE
jgi:DNA-binding MarR family transcriptional regulator